MPREVDEESAPVLVEERLAGLRLRADGLPVRVDVVNHVSPRTHRVARDVGPEPALPAELHVSVEHRVVERPLPVSVPLPSDHRAVCVVALVVPWLVHERHGERLLPGVGEHLPQRLHRRVVRVRERLNAVHARDGPRMLPEVEEVLPFARRRKDPVHDGHDELAHPVLARLRVRRGGDRGEVDPRRLRAVLRAVRDRPVLERVAGVVAHRHQRAAANLYAGRGAGDFGIFVGYYDRVALAAPYRDAKVEPESRACRAERRQRNCLANVCRIHCLSPFVTSLRAALTNSA